MPALPPAASTIRVRWKGTYGIDTDVIWRQYFQYSGTPPTATQLATFAAAAAGVWNSQLAGYHSSGYTLTEVDVEDLNSSGGATGTWTGSHAGTDSGTLLPAATCALLNLSIARRYRGGKPRRYLPIGTQTNTTNQQEWNSTFISNVGSEWAAIAGYLEADIWSGGGTLTEVNVSYYAGFASVQNPVTKRWRNIPTPRPTAATVDVIQAWALNPKFGSQRRRNTHSP